MVSLKFTPDWGSCFVWFCSMLSLSPLVLMGHEYTEQRVGSHWGQNLTHALTGSPPVSDLKWVKWTGQPATFTPGVGRCPQLLYSAVASTSCALTFSPAPSPLGLTDHMVREPWGPPPSNSWGYRGSGKHSELSKVTEPVGGRAWCYDNHSSSASSSSSWLTGTYWVVIMYPDLCSENLHSNPMKKIFSFF